MAEKPSTKQGDPSDCPKGPFYPATANEKSTGASHCPPASRKRPRSALQKALFPSNDVADLKYASEHKNSDTFKPALSASENIPCKPGIYEDEATDGALANLPGLNSVDLGEESGILTELIALENIESLSCPSVKRQKSMNNQSMQGGSSLASSRKEPDDRSRRKFSGEETQAVKFPPLRRSGSKKIASTNRPSSSRKKSSKESDDGINFSDELLTENKFLAVDKTASNGDRAPYSTLPSATVARNSKEPVRRNVKKCKKLAPGDSPLLASLGRTPVSESSKQNQSRSEAGSMSKRLHVAGNALESLSSNKRSNSVLLGGGSNGNCVDDGSGGGSSSGKYSSQHSVTEKCTSSEKTEPETSPTPSAGDSSTTQDINISPPKTDLRQGGQPRRKKKPAKRTPIRKRREDKGFEDKPISLGPNIPHILGGMNICFRLENGRKSLPRKTRLWISNIKTNYAMSHVKKSVEGAVKESQPYKKYCAGNENMTFSLRFLGIDGKEHRIKEGQIKFRKILEKHGIMYAPNSKNADMTEVAEPIPSLAVFVDMPALSSESEAEELKESSTKNGSAEPDPTEIGVVEVGAAETDAKDCSVAENSLS